MMRRSRVLVEVTSWLTQHVDGFFKLTPYKDELGASLVAFDPRTVDATWVGADLYDARFFPDVLKVEPRGILAPDYVSPLLKEPLIAYTFVGWSPREPARDGAAGKVSKEMWRHIVADLFGIKPEGVGRRRFAGIAEMLRQRIPGYAFQHLATVETAGDLVSVFVDLHSLGRVSRVIE
jgi:hypothetical protein